MKEVRAIKVKLEQIMENDAPDAATKHWVVPAKATILSGSNGTLLQVDTGDYYLATAGEWFRSVYIGKAMPQVDSFDKLQDIGITAIKDKIVRNDAKPKEVVKQNEQELRSKNNVSTKKAGKTVGTNSPSQKKD
jgi:hypothetical protein